MKENRLNPKEEAQKTLEILNEINRIKGNPYLFSKIAKANRQKEESPTYHPALAFMLAASLLILNTFVWFQNMPESDSIDATLNEVLSQDYEYYLSIENFENDLVLGSSSIEK